MKLDMLYVCSKGSQHASHPFSLQVARYLQDKHTSQALTPLTINFIIAATI